MLRCQYPSYSHIALFVFYWFLSIHILSYRRPIIMVGRCCIKCLNCEFVACLYSIYWLLLLLPPLFLLCLIRELKNLAFTRYDWVERLAAYIELLLLFNPSLQHHQRSQTAKLQCSSPQILWVCDFRLLQLICSGVQPHGVRSSLLVWFGTFAQHQNSVSLLKYGSVSMTALRGLRWCLQIFVVTCMFRLDVDYYLWLSFISS